MILGGSGFIGQELYQELSGFYSVHASYNRSSERFGSNMNFHQWNVETEPLEFLLNNLKPDLIISAMRGDFNAQISAHFEAINYILKTDSKLIFLSSANVFDAFTNYPSYEYDKSFSTSIYGRFKISIENALLRLPNDKYNIIRLPMVFGAGSPRLEELKTLHKKGEPIEVFPNVVINAHAIGKLRQQIHYLINQDMEGVWHLGSTDLIHHDELILEICKKLSLENPKIKLVFESNDDRFLAVLPKTHRLPQHLRITVEEVIEASSVLK